MKSAPVAPPRFHETHGSPPPLPRARVDAARRTFLARGLAGRHQPRGGLHDRRRFGGKDALFLAAFDDHIERRLRQYLDAATAAPDFESACRELGRAAIAAGRREPGWRLDAAADGVLDARRVRGLLHLGRQRPARPVRIRPVRPGSAHRTASTCPSASTPARNPAARSRGCRRSRRPTRWWPRSTTSSRRSCSRTRAWRSREPNPAGRPYRHLAAIDGRTADTLVFPAAGGGTVALLPLRIGAPFARLPEVRQFQVVHERGRLVVRLAFDPAGPAANLKLVISRS